MSEYTDKKYPLASAEVAKMMGFDKSADDESGQGHASTDQEHAVAGHAVPAGLPVIEHPVAVHSQPSPSQQEHLEHKQQLDALKSEIIDNPLKAGTEEPVIRFPFLPVLKLIGRFVLIFAVGIFLYLFFFSHVDFSSLFQSRTAAQSSQDKALAALEKQNLSAYNTWISSYYYDVSDTSVLDPNTDNSGNGLTNFQKYLLDLNPKAYDTLGLGMPDSQALQDGINPASGQPLTAQQKQIIGTYIDMSEVMNKLALNKADQNIAGTIAGVQTAQAAGIESSTVPSTTPVSTINTTSAVSDDNLPTSFGTAQTTASASDYGDNVMQADLDINQNVPGELDIPSLNIKAPLIFSNSSANFENDLKNGVIHYPGTALPGQIGTSYIAGHSSNYPWIKSNYNQIFTHLDKLAVNDSFSITVTLNNGQKVTLHYVVTGSKQYSPTDPAQIANTGLSTVNLSTCWPVNTTQKRLVVTGQLTQVDQ